MRDQTETWTAPAPPDVAAAAVEDEALASRSMALPWMEPEVRRSSERRFAAIDVFSAVVLIAFLVALFLALPLLLLRAL